VAPNFIKILQKQISDLWAAGTNVNDLGRIVNDFHMQRLCELMKDHEGNVIMGNPNAHTDSNLTPTVILDPSPDSPLM
jgi:aldehyde dehydrogenase (NAD+)